MGWEKDIEESGGDIEDQPLRAMVMFLLSMAENKSYDPQQHLHTEVIKYWRAWLDD